jgi:hypothetical protein
VTSKGVAMDEEKKISTWSIMCCNKAQDSNTIFTN